MLKFAQRFVFTTYLICVSLHGALQFETNDAQKFEETAKSLGAKYGNENVLLAYDIDKTLLTSNQPLGGDDWFMWQSKIVGTADPMAVAADFAGLLKVQGLLYNLERMHPPDPTEPEMVKRLQDSHFPSMVLTARGSEMRNATLQHFKGFYDFSKSGFNPKSGFPGTYLPYDAKHIQDFGLNENEKVAFKLENTPRPVSYMDGIFMTAGQHKGAMLRTLLKKAKRSYRAVLFLDDQQKNCDAVYNAFKARPTEVVTIHYTKEEKGTEEFQNKKQAANEAWLELKTVVEKNFPQTMKKPSKLVE